MKNLSSCLIILSIFISCSNDPEAILAEGESSVPEDIRLAYRQENDLPVNPDNIYDAAGVLYYELVEAYDVSQKSDTIIPLILAETESLASQSSHFQSIKGATYTTGDTLPLHYIADFPLICVGEVIGRTGMGSVARTSLLDFLTDLKEVCKEEEEFEDVFDFIIEYEDSIIGSTVLSTGEKQTILTATSISRFAAFRKRKPKKNRDQDWDWLIAGIVAGVDGLTEHSLGNAITSSVTMSVYFE